MTSLYPFYKRHTEETIIPFWIRALDHKNGGVYSCFNNSGDKLISKDKYTWSQGRFLWLWSKIATMIDEGRLRGESNKYYEHAHKTVQFLEKNVFLKNGNCAFLLTETGDKKESSPGEGYDSSIFADFFVALGIGVYAGLTKDIKRFESALELYDHIAGRIKTGAFRSEPYPVPAGYRSHAIPMIMLHVTQELAAVADALHHDISNELHKNAKSYIKIIMDEFTQADHRVVEMLPVDTSVKNTLLYRHVNPGHTIESMWFVMQSAQQYGWSEYIEKASRIIIRAMEMGWDADFGGFLRFTDADGGKPIGEFKGTAYEKLVMDTWDMKLWWPHSEALYATLLAYNLTGNNEMLDLHDTIHEYTFRTFPHPDPSIGEWIQIRDRKGNPVDKVAALPVKDPYHILRNMLLITELLEE